MLYNARVDITLFSIIYDYSQFDCLCPGTVQWRLAHHTAASSFICVELIFFSIIYNYSRFDCPCSGAVQWRLLWHTASDRPLSWASDGTFSSSIEPAVVEIWPFFFVLCLFILGSTAAVPALCSGDYCSVQLQIDLCFALLMVPSDCP